ncbi:MAG: hypothetical protein C4320_04125, partial [Armatimonadota bacterium]
MAVNGSLAKWAKVESDDRGIIEARRVEGGVTLEARRTGDAVVTLAAGGAVKAIAVSVRRWAVEFPQTLSANVVGAPATAETVRGAVEGAVFQSLQRAPGTVISFAVEKTAAAGPQSTLRIPVRIKAYGPGSLPSEGRVTVEVHNNAPRLPLESALWYSNNPETFRQPQGLFAAQLEPGQRVRMLHHHLNGARYAMYMRVLAINDGDEAVTLGVTGGESGPDRDPVRAGLNAGGPFLRAWPSGSA